MFLFIVVSWIPNIPHDRTKVVKVAMFMTLLLTYWRCVNVCHKDLDGCDNRCCGREGRWCRCWVEGKAVVAGGWEDESLFRVRRRWKTRSHKTDESADRHPIIRIVVPRVCMLVTGSHACACVHVSKRVHVCELLMVCMTACTWCRGGICLRACIIKVEDVVRVDYRKLNQH